MKYLQSKKIAKREARAGALSRIEFATSRTALFI
jgi:hypothetical protein